MYLNDLKCLQLFTYLCILLPRFFLFSTTLPTISPPRNHCFRFKVSKDVLADDFDNPTAYEINNHGHSQSELELMRLLVIYLRQESELKDWPSPSFQLSEAIYLTRA